MTAIDHILAGLLVATCLSQLFAHLDRESHTRLQFYLAGGATASLFGLIPLLLWWIERRQLAGFGLHGWQAGGIAVAAAAAWAAALIAALLLIRGGVQRARIARIYRDYAWIMPRSGGELAASWVISAAAGAGEEIAFRGFLLWYAIIAIGAPGGLVLASIVFGCAHAYQRVRGMIWATAAGLMLGGAYLASESLVLVIWMHATWNMASFTAGRMVLAPATVEGAPAPL